MKILGLKIRNITTLRGDWEIRFDRPPLSDATLFAIVGPNGSGKSSILDALTLALYGETARLRNPGPETMSPQTEDSQAEVAFSVTGKLYRSRWSVQKVDGEPQPPRMCLVSLDGDTESILEDRVVRVRERVAELSGLDFKRFCCSILLPQGDFAAFLNALGNERAQILEGLVGREMAVELGESIRGRAAAETEKLHQLKEAAQGVVVLDGARLNEIRHSLETNQAELLETDRALNDLRSRVDRLESVENLKAAEGGAEGIVSEAQARQAKAREEAEVLNRARAVEPLREALRALDALEDDSVSLQSKLNELHESIPSAEAGIAELEARLQCVHPEVEEALLRLERDRDLLENASLRDREIETETNRYRDAVTRYEEIDRLVGEHVKERDRIVQRVPQVESRAAELRSWLDEHSSCGDLQNRIPEAQEILRSLDDTRRRLRDDRARKSDALNEEKQKAGKLDKSQRVTARAREKLNLLEQRRDAADQVLHDLTGNREPKSLHDDLLALQEKLSAYERLMEIGRKYHHLPALGDMDAEMGRMELERDRVAQALSQEEAALGELAEGLKKRDEVRKHNLDRTDLEAGKACPLCGAMDHPYTAGELPDFSDLDRVVHEHEGKIAAFQEELQGLETKLTELRQRSEEADLRRREWTEACLPAGGEWGYSDVNLIEYEAKALRNDISAVKSRIRGSRWRTWKARWDAFVLGRVKDKLFRKEQVEGGIRKEHELLKQELADLDERIRRGEEDERAMLSTLSSGFGMDNEAIASPGTEMDWLQRMVNRSNEYQARRQEMDALDGELGALGSRREQILCELPGFEEEKEALSIEVQAGMSRLSELRAERETLFGDLDPLGRRQALESDIENRRAEQAALNQQLEILREKIDIEQAALPKLKVELQEVLVQFEDDKRRLMERAAASGLQTIQELRTMAAVLDDGENVRKRLAEAEEALNRAVSELAAVRGELESVRAGRSVEESMDTLQAGISEKLERRLALQEGIEEAEGLMKERARADAEHRGLLQAIAVQERICSEALAEQEKLQPANAAQTESRLQHLLLERLVGHTNKHLAFLSDRYTLQLAGETGLGLHVEDSHQRLTHRSAGTLSGGETFLVSLCLALGLSDMAAMNHRIESLFLDEGFGSLDEEMLYKVIATLKALDRYGMQVGVVSHVKRLGDEISTQIKVTREPTGFSSIKILP